MRRDPACEYVEREFSRRVLARAPYYDRHVGNVGAWISILLLDVVIMTLIVCLALGFVGSWCGWGAS